jgi:hypothetical protein
MVGAGTVTTLCVLCAVVVSALGPAHPSERAFGARQGTTRALIDTGPNVTRRVLVVHIGPHKTGTTSLQYFLQTHAAAIETMFGIGIPRLVNHAGKFEAYSARGVKAFAHLHSTVYLDTCGGEGGRVLSAAEKNLQPMYRPEVAQELVSVINRNDGFNLKIISAEDFVQMCSAGWTKLQSLLPDWDFQFLAFYRPPGQRIVSAWKEIHAGSAMPSTFLQVMDEWAEVGGAHPTTPQRRYDHVGLKKHGFGDYGGQTDVALAAIREALPGAVVDGATLAALKEENSTVASFTVCKYTFFGRSHSREEWRACRRWVRATSAKDPNMNVGIKDVYFDAARLGYVLNSADGQSTSGRLSTRELLARDAFPALRAFPTTCADIGHMFSPEWMGQPLFFNLTGAVRAKADVDPEVRLCRLESRSLTAAHLHAIRSWARPRDTAPDTLL